MISVALAIPKFSDGTSWYRAMGPWNDLRRRCRNLNLVTMQMWDWSTVGGCDLMFLQRPYTKEAVGKMEWAKDCGIPVWLDYDDLLIDLPTDNPAYFHYMEEGKQKNLRFMIENADVITVSTEHLKKCLVHINKNIVVVPNALNMKPLNQIEKTQGNIERKNIMAWRGSATHFRDVFAMAPEIIPAAKDETYKDWQWHFIGDMMWFVTDSLVHERTYVTKPVEIVEYHRHIWKLGAKAFMVPLSPSHFNLCKSNIAWLEATWSGSAAIVPEWPEWNKPGALTYNSPNDFKELLVDVLRGEIDTEKCRAQSWEHIQDSYTLEKVNTLRLGVLESLLEIDRSELGWKEK